MILDDTSGPPQATGAYHMSKREKEKCSRNCMNSAINTFGCGGSTHPLINTLLPIMPHQDVLLTASHTQCPVSPGSPSYHLQPSLDIFKSGLSRQSMPIYSSASAPCHNFSLSTRKRRERENKCVPLAQDDVSDNNKRCWTWIVSAVTQTIQ